MGSNTTKTFSATTYNYHTYNAADYPVATGTPVVAADGGTVT